VLQDLQVMLVQISSDQMSILRDEVLQLTRVDIYMRDSSDGVGSETDGSEKGKGRFKSAEEAREKAMHRLRILVQLDAEHFHLYEPLWMLLHLPYEVITLLQGID